MGAGVLADRVGIVTGASAGIGRAIAADLVSHGARVVVNARRAERLLEVVEQLDKGRTEPAAAMSMGDASDQGTIDSMFDAAVNTFKTEPDLVVINAGRGLAGSVATSDDGEWEELVRTNVLGAARLARTTARRMLAQIEEGDATGWQKRPRDIVVIGSIVGRHVSPFSSMYGATKFAVHGMTEGLRRELAPKGIRVTLIEPGFVVSEFQGVAGYKDDWFKGVVDRIGPVLEPVDVARAVSFVCSQPAHVHIGDIVVRPTRQDYP